MKPSIKVITLGVRDLARSLAFYRDGLGLPTRGIVGTEFEDGTVGFFELDGGLVLALFPQVSLARDASIPEASGTGGMSLGHNVGSREEVDALLAQAVRAGATLTQAARDRPWGIYAGYFRDPDGHLWEVAWNPAWG